MAKKDEKQITHQNFDEWMDPPKVPNILVKKEPKRFHFGPPWFFWNPYVSGVKKKDLSIFAKDHEPPEVNPYTWDATKHKSW